METAKNFIAGEWVESTDANLIEESCEPCPKRAW